MQDRERVYIAIDLKSFYASVECVERGLDPLNTNLVVADVSRTEKTICLAVSPSLKRYGIPGRARLFEVVQRVREVNRDRKIKAPGKEFSGSSFTATELDQNASLELTYIAAPPRMALYMDYSTRIYNIYLKYIAPEDIHVYSVDEVFIDATSYLATYKMTPRQLAGTMVREVLGTTGITATAGIGTNLYLCKVAMDIEAKHCKADEDGVRIAELNEQTYREKLWSHRPLTDFWRVGRGYAKKLEENGLYTMGDVARCSVGSPKDYYNEELLYRLFGINAELLIDHAWGYEPVRISDIKSYKPETNSISQGQVLPGPYTYEKTRIIVREMTELLVLDMVEKGFVTSQMVLTVLYDIENLTNPEIMKKYKGPVTVDFYGRAMPKHAHGTIHLKKKTASTQLIVQAVMELFDRIIDPNLLTRKIYVVAAKIEKGTGERETIQFEQLDLFTDYEERDRLEEEQEKRLSRERNMQRAMLDIKKRYGKNAIVKGTDLQEGATSIERNGQIGGHKA